MPPNQPHTITSSLAGLSRSPNSAPGDETAEEARDQQILTLLARLSAHFWRPDYKPVQAREVWIDWLADLRGLSVPAIAAACDAYRRDPKSEFFPKPGHLRILATAEQKDIEARTAYKRLSASPSAAFRESRPIMWWLLPKELWRPSWRDDEVPLEYRNRSKPPDQSG